MQQPLGAPGQSEPKRDVSVESSDARHSVAIEIEDSEGFVSRLSLPNGEPLELGSDTLSDRQGYRDLWRRIPTRVVSNSISNRIKFINTEHALAAMRRGSCLLKWCRGPRRKVHLRMFFLSPDEQCLCWHKPGNVKQTVRTMRMSNVRRILPGCDSDFLKKRNIGSWGIEITGAKKLYLACRSEEEWQNWMKGLMALHEKTIKWRCGAPHYVSNFLGQLWSTLVNSKQKLQSRNDACELVASLNMQNRGVVTNVMIDALCNIAQVEESQQFQTFCDIIFNALRRPALEDLFASYSDKDNLLTPDKFKELLKSVQGETCDHYIDRLANYTFQLPSPHVYRGKLTEVGLSVLFSSEINSLMKNSTMECYQDMTLPMANYWIAASHNTYLTGDQLIGGSAVGRYIDVLLSGCRCVELDCWDGPNGEPVLYHGIKGYPLSQSIQLADVIRACKDYGFQKSPWPIILSLEMHCSPPQKVRTGQIIHSILGLQLYQGDYNMPSPLQLKRMFVIKARVPFQSGNIDTSADLAGRRWRRTGAPQLEAMRKDLIDNYYRNVTLRGMKFKPMPETSTEFTIFSMNETVFHKNAKKQPENMCKFFQAHMARIYPHGSRVASSNFDPMPIWLHGAQMAALNYQSPGIPMMVAHGRFLENGGVCGGYVLKPSILRNPDQVFNASQPFDDCKPYRLSLKILSAHQLPPPKSYRNLERARSPAPRVHISVHGLTSDHQEATTGIADFAHHFFTWAADDSSEIELSVKFPELAILLVQVLYNDPKNSLIGFNSFPIHCLRSGIRWVGLLDAHHHAIPWAGILLDCKFCSPAH